MGHLLKAGPASWSYRVWVRMYCSLFVGFAAIAVEATTWEGTTLVEFAVSQGSASYTIPIAVSPGRGGM